MFLGCCGCDTDAKALVLITYGPQSINDFLHAPQDSTGESPEASKKSRRAHFDVGEETETCTGLNDGDAEEE